MSQRVCANCETEITDNAPDMVMFCDRQCCDTYLREHDDVPEEPRYV